MLVLPSTDTELASQNLDFAHVLQQDSLLQASDLFLKYGPQGAVSPPLPQHMLAGRGQTVDDALALTTNWLGAEEGGWLFSQF